MKDMTMIVDSDDNDDSDYDDNDHFEDDNFDYKSSGSIDCSFAKNFKLPMMNDMTMTVMTWPF